MKPTDLGPSGKKKLSPWNIVNEYMIQSKDGKESFHFDRVFGQHHTTEDIFHSDVQHLMANALKGYNVTVLAYGQTSSGKTFTIRGNEEALGIIQLTARELFKWVVYLKTSEGIAKSLKNDHGDSLNLPSQESFFGCNGDLKEAEESNEEGGMIDRSISLGVSYLEIYNESVNDLLDGSKKNLDVREHKGEVFIDQLTHRAVNCSQDILDVLNEGDKLRKEAETKANSKSSRSHSVFRISVEIDDKNTHTGRRTIRSSQIQIVDLAGSEGASKTRSAGLRLREGGNINKSLLALSNVIWKLSQRQQMGSKHNYYINFRDSKLTRILQNSLCGRSQTAIICCISSL
jgi:centromeric protein E